MEFRVIKSEYRGQNLLVQNYLFKKNKSHNGIEYYKCCNNNCRSTLTINLSTGSIEREPSEHNHCAPDHDVAELQFREKIVNEVQVTPTIALKKIYNEQLEVNDENFVPPRFEPVRKLLSRKRSSILPVNPKNFEDVILEGEWTKNLNDQDFVLFQEPKLIIFATKKSLEFLTRSSYLLSDGTFKTAPPPFIQIYTVFAAEKNWKLPVVWVF